MKLFITGTDTGVGKTYVSASILKTYKRRGMSTLGLKPVSSGCERKNGVLYNEDALALQNASSIKLPYEKINPFAFEPPIAPHIAAQQIGQSLSLDLLNEKMRDALNHPADVCLIEGAGGWHTPLNYTETLAHFAIHHHLPVILVIGIRLGCINHSILTCQSIQQSGATFVGWIANCMTPDIPHTEEIINTLRNWLPQDCLGIIKHKKRRSNC